jgi:hypothetical protein
VATHVLVNALVDHTNGTSSSEISCHLTSYANGREVKFDMNFIYKFLTFYRTLETKVS